MIDHAVRYMKQHSATFRLVSYPTSEMLPDVAQRPPPNSQVVDTYVVLVDGMPGLACVPAGVPLDVISFAQEIHGMVMEGTVRDLPAPFNETDFVPPLGGLIGVPVFMDRRVASSVISFRVFGKEDFLQVQFDDYARIEKPRIAVIAVAGALPESTTDTGERDVSAQAVIEPGAPVMPATDAALEAPGAGAPPAAGERAAGVPVPLDEERTRLSPPEPPARPAGKHAAPRTEKHAAPRPKRGGAAHRH